MPSLSTPFSTEAEDQSQQNSSATGQNPTTAAPSTATATGGGGSAPMGAGSTPGASPAGNANPAPTSSGAFTNLNKYIYANKDFAADQGGLAGKMANNVQNQATRTQNNIAGAQQAFTNQSNSNIQGAVQNQNTYAQALADPYGFSKDSANTANLNQALKAQYTGPASLNDLSGTQNYNNLQTQVANVANTANQARTESGRYNMLSSMFGKPSYNAGDQSLDNLMIQSNPQQMQKLASTQQVANGLTSTFNKADTNTQALAAANTGLANTISQNTHNALQAGIGNIDSDLASKVAASNAQTAQWIKDMQSGKLTSQEAQALGFTNGQKTYGADLTNSSLYNPNYQATAANVASQDQYNNYQALAGMLGIAPTTLGGTYNASAAFNPSSAINAQAINAAITAAQGNYNNQDQQTLGQLTSALEGGGPTHQIGVALGWNPNGTQGTDRFSWNTYANPYDMNTASGVQQLLDSLSLSNPNVSRYQGDSTFMGDVNSATAQAQALLNLINSNKTINVSG